jgi:hypothetical protein
LATTTRVHGWASPAIAVLFITLFAAPGWRCGDFNELIGHLADYQAIANQAFDSANVIALIWSSK